MKRFGHLMVFETKNIIRGKFHIVLLITFVVVVGVYHVLPQNLNSVPVFESSAKVNIEIMASDGNFDLGDLYLSVILSFEVAILGFLFIAVTLFSEKEEGIIRAYRISPAGSFLYVTSKILTWALISTLYGVAVMMSTKITGFYYPVIFLLIFLSSFLMTAFGMFIAIFFKNLSDWFFPGISMLVINMLPQLGAADYMNDFPVFKIIPGYWIFQSFKTIGDQNLVQQDIPVITGLAIASLVMLILTVMVSHLKLMKESN